MIRILLVDDQNTFREALRAMLKPATDIEVVGIASDGYAAIESVGIVHPDVVLIDMEMPGLNGIQATRKICEDYTDVKVLIFSMHDGDEYVSQSLSAGAMGYLLKNTPAQELIESIRFVHRGYAQIGPGLMGKVIPKVATGKLRTEKIGCKPPSKSPLKPPAPPEVQLSFSPISLRNRLEVPLFANAIPLSKPKLNWKYYLALWLVGNAFIWSVGLLYLRFTPPVYRSDWTIVLPGARSAADVDLPGIGRASAYTESPYSRDTSDPRENYKDLAETPEVLEVAAKQLRMPLSEFGKPRIEIVQNSTLMKLEMKGDTAQAAQQKAYALQTALNGRIEELRREESAQQDRNLEVALRVAEQRLHTAQQSLSNYQTHARINSNTQINDLSTNIEQLRRQRAETVAEVQQITAHLNQQSRTLGLSAQQAADAFVLQTDQLFRRHLADYSQASADLVNLQAQFMPSHPLVATQQAKKNAAQSALLERGQQLLGRSLALATLKQFNLSADSNSSDAHRANLFQELITLQGQVAGSKENAQALEQQITQLENRMVDLSKKGVQLASLQRDVQVAEAVFSSTLTRLSFGKSNISAAYPPISLFAKPQLPESPTAPQPKLVLLGMLLCSVFLSTGTLSLWYRNRKAQPTLLQELPSPLQDLLPQSNGYVKTLNNQDTNTRTKV
jgi:DNA-binding NarL/FixJ family response regulator/uncharacterized protein involved in exopolysaccharide biosynthesis